MDLQQHQEMSLEMQLDRIRRQLADMQATQDILVNYMQAVALAMGLKEKIRELDAKLDEIRAGNLEDEEPPPDTKP